MKKYIIYRPFEIQAESDILVDTNVLLALFFGTRAKLKGRNCLPFQ